MTTPWWCLALAVSLVIRASAESNTTNILDGVATDATGPFTLGASGSLNFLLITNGGRLSNTVGTIGNSSLAFSNLAVVTGVDSLWANGGSFVLGDRGSANSLIVENAATLRANSTFIGNDSGGNRAFVKSASVVNAGPLWIGTSLSASGNLLSLAGPGSVWTNGSRITLGRDGSDNHISISDGAALRLGSRGTTGFTVGNSAVSRSNQLLVSGPGSALLGNWALILGFTGSENSLVVSDGAFAQSDYADIGQNCFARDNVAFITGGGTVWSNGLLQVGFCSTNNHLVVSNGAQVFAGLVRSSVQGGASNTISVTGPGSLLRAAGDLIVGNSGTANSLAIANGGRVEGRNDRIGWTGGNHAATLHDFGTSWSNSSLTIGDATPGNQLTVAEGAHIASGSAILGAGAKSSGNAALFLGTGSAWDITTNLVLGGLGHSNSLMLSEGARVSARDVYLGAGSLMNPTALYSSDWNSLRLEGTNTLVNAISNVSVGAYGRFNRLQILDGARVNDVDGLIGSGSGSRSNSVLVSGAGAIWNNLSNLMVGGEGTRSELTISRGGRVINLPGYLGWMGEFVGAGSSCFARVGENKVLVTDPGSLWETRGPLFVGFRSIGNILVVSNGGTVTANALLVGATNSIAPGSVCAFNLPLNQLVIAGGRLAVTNANSDAVLEVRHGTILLQSGVIKADRLVGKGGSLLFYGGTLRIREGDITYSGFGAGFRVGGDITSSTLVLEGGTLNVEHSFGVEGNAVLAGNGVVNSPFNSINGTIAPGGREPGRLKLLGGLFTLGMGGLASLSLDIAGTEPGVEYDQLVTDNATYFFGRLDVRLRGGFIPRSSDMFEVFKCNFLEPEVGFWNVSTNGRVLTVDRLGSFRVNYGPTNIVLTEYRSTDLDGDGIEDAWATNYFGHSPLTVSEKSADADGDGASNGDEFNAGTDPLNPASVFRISILGSVYLPSPLVEFPCVPGKEYLIWYSSDLVTWHEVPHPTIDFACGWSDDGTGTGGVHAPSRFYRVTME